MAADQPSEQSIMHGLAKLYRETKTLNKEVKTLQTLIHDFNAANRTKDSNYDYGVLPPSAGGVNASRYETFDPQSKIHSATYDYRDTSDLETPTRVIIAIAKDLDGALRDIRSARTKIESIADY